MSTDYAAAQISAAKNELNANFKKEVSDECLSCSLSQVRFDEFETSFAEKIYEVRAKCNARHSCIEDIKPDLTNFFSREVNRGDGGLDIHFAEYPPWHSDIKPPAQDDQELNDAIEYETRSPKYDNFGSW
ncbi:MAG: hypothetical protein ABJG42_24390 [Vibrio splendidus]